MGRAPCCDKANVKKGPWSPEEDAKLKSYIEQHGTGGNWIALPQKIGLKRCGKSCRLRWLNYLRPNIKHGGFSEEEDSIICNLYISIGSRWSIIAAQLPGRTDNDIKNYWNTRLKKKLLGKHRKEQKARKGCNLKQDQMKRGNKNSISMAPDNNNNESPYWPELPVLAPIPYSNEENRFNDHEAIRKFLIKLGGRFSEDDQHVHNRTSSQFPVDMYPNPQFYEQSLSMPSSSSMDALNSSNKQYLQTLYNIDGTDSLALQDQNNLQADLGEMVNSNPERLEGLGFFYGDIVMNNITDMASRETIGWGDESSWVYSSVGPNYEDIQQWMPHQYAHNDLRYPGTQ